MRAGRQVAVSSMALAAVALATMLSVSAFAAGIVVKRSTKVFQVPAARLTTVTVPFPDALKFAGATYSGTVRFIAPRAGASGQRPSLLRVRVTGKGPAEGGSVLRVRIRSTNPPGTKPVQAVVTAITREPAGG